MDKSGGLRTLRTLITIKSVIMDKGKVVTYFINNMNKKREELYILDPVPSIKFLYFDDTNVKNGSIVVTIDGIITATTSCEPCHMMKHIECFEEHIKKICKLIDIPITHPQIHITEGFRMRETKSPPSKKLQVDEPSGHRYMGCSSTVYQNPEPKIVLGRFHIPENCSHSPFQLKGVVYKDKGK